MTETLNEINCLMERRGKKRNYLQLNITITHRHALLPVLLQDGVRGRSTQTADSVRLPAAVHAGRVGVVQLEAVVPVVPRVQEGHAERPQTTELGVGLLVVAWERIRFAFGFGIGEIDKKKNVRV